MTIDGKQNLEISIVIPAYNEKENIEEVVNKSKAVLEKLKKKFEILIVNDGSVDNTGDICNNLSKNDRKIRIIHHNKNLGIGAALQTLFKNAKGELIFFIPADGQQDILEITNFLEAIKDCDIVCGYRKKRIDPFYRRLNSQFWNFLVRVFFGLKIKDLNWVKMYRSEVFKNITLNSDGAFLDSEILVKAKKRGFRIKELSTNHFPRKFGKPSGNNPLVVLRAFKDFFKFYSGINRS